MADIQLRVLSPGRGGTVVSSTEATATVPGDHVVGVVTADNYKIPNDGRTIVRLSNSAGTPTVTIVTYDTVDGLAVTDRTYAIPAIGAVVYLSDFQPDIYNDTNGNLDLSFSAADTTLRIEVIR